jgi:hypothetical protein
MDFNTWLDKAWDDHVNTAVEVAERIEREGVGLVGETAQVVPLAHLAHHVFGEHLGRFDDGSALLTRVAALPVAADAEAAAAIARYQAALALAAGRGDARSGQSPSERVRIAALAMASLAPRDAARAERLLDEAVAEAESAALDDKDPAVRALAAMANNVAGTLAEKALPADTALVHSAALSDTERRLMGHAAQVARRFWERAGTWLEVERAEYRLALCALAAGELGAARRHAQACLEIVREHDSAPLEAFFGWEALGRVERAAGNATGHGRALEQARAAFERLETGDQAWCRSSLEALGAAAPTS